MSEQRKLCADKEEEGWGGHETFARGIVLVTLTKTLGVVVCSAKDITKYGHVASEFELHHYEETKICAVIGGLEEERGWLRYKRL